MAIDTRAIVQSNLGPVITASIGDDYIQNNGLIKCSGSCLISGLVSPPTGTRVYFYYTKNGITRSIPRPLRVLSSFADPFRRTTSIQLGCKLTYLQELRDPIEWSAFDDPENSGLTEDDAKVIVIPIAAQSVAWKCLDALKITATGLVLTNKFSVESFDFGPGYVQVLGDLMVSECLCGYLNEQEVLEVFRTNVSGGTGPLLAEQSIIDVGEIGVGQLPGDAVTVSYSTLKLALPDGEEIDPEDRDLFKGWTESSNSSESLVTVSYKPRDNPSSSMLFRTYRAFTASEEQATYEPFTVFRSGADTTQTGEKEVVSLLTKRETTSTTSSVSELGGFATDILSIGVDFLNPSIQKKTVETYEYDEFGREVSSTLVTTGDSIFLSGGYGIDWVYDDPGGGYSYVTVFTGFEVFIEKTITHREYVGDYTKETVQKFAPWSATIAGQQTIASVRQYINSADEAASVMNTLLADALVESVPFRQGLYLIETSTSTSQGIPSPQSRPSDSEVVADAYGGYSTESKSELELATGNPSATLRVEFSMPYAPDDKFCKISSDPVKYGSVASDAPQKARNFGVTQNRMLLGNRYGMNIQTVPELVPLKPFSAFYVLAAGTYSLYRTNGTSWTIDSNGIIVSTDGMFWGVAGREV